MGLLNQIANDEIVLPAIQRDFVWSEGQTQTLLDSVMRGYPIGIALLWETYNDIQYRRFPEGVPARNDSDLRRQLRAQSAARGARWPAAASVAVHRSARAA
jgi:hypothetical protein